jgi:transposase InsO family protein
MPWEVPAVPEIRFALCHAVRSCGEPLAAAARRFGVSRKTAYKWLARHDAAPGAPLCDRSRRPLRSPGRTPEVAEHAVLGVRDRFNWGPRKIRAFLLQDAARRGEPPPAGLPSVRTCAAVLARHGRVGPRGPAPAPPDALQRFERAAPNELWQADFKGPVEVARRRVMPLSVIDDHSRYLLAFRPCADRTMATAWAVLWDVFGECGLPQQLLCDGGFKAQQGRYAGAPAPGLGWFDARLIRLGIRPCHGRPRHPQTQGKVERLHGSSDRELTYFDARRDTPEHYAADCERWRATFNTLRPHEALADAPPATRWRPARDRPRPATLPEPGGFYPPGAELRRVGASGDVRVDGCRVLCGRGITGQHVRLERRAREVAIFYCWKEIRTITHEGLRGDTML